MWCTRWYLPLLLLPLPTAPVYFLVLFLFALSLHAEPCLYCMSILSTLFMTSYYWQPVPLTHPLTTPWIANTTTYGDVLNLLLPNHRNVTENIRHLELLAANMSDLPSNAEDAETANMTITEPTIPLLDRGWCDIVLGGSIFEPFNITRWELASVEHYRDELLRQEKEAAMLIARMQQSETASSVATEVSEKDDESTTIMPENDEYGSAKRRWQELFLFPSLGRKKIISSPTETLISPPSESGEAPSPIPPSPLPLAETATPVATTQPHADSTPRVEERLPWLRREYDLKPYGFGVVLDFGWSRRPREGKVPLTHT